MMISRLFDYCWSDKGKPYKVVSIEHEGAAVQGHTMTKIVPFQQIKGCCCVGDRTLVLTSGCYIAGTVMDAPVLTVLLDRFAGHSLEIHDGKYLFLFIDVGNRVIFRKGYEIEPIKPGEWGQIKSMKGNLCKVNFARITLDVPVAKLTRAKNA